MRCTGQLDHNYRVANLEAGVRFQTGMSTMVGKITIGLAWTAVFSASICLSASTINASAQHASEGAQRANEGRPVGKLAQLPPEVWKTLKKEREEFEASGAVDRFSREELKELYRLQMLYAASGAAAVPTLGSLARLSPDERKEAINRLKQHAARDNKPVPSRPSGSPLSLEELKELEEWRAKSDLKAVPTIPPSQPSASALGGQHGGGRSAAYGHVAAKPTLGQCRWRTKQVRTPLGLRPKKICE
jgi:hypothetical protein